MIKTCCYNFLLAQDLRMLVFNFFGENSGESWVSSFFHSFHFLLQRTHFIQIEKVLVDEFLFLLFPSTLLEIKNIPVDEFPAKKFPHAWAMTPTQGRPRPSFHGWVYYPVSHTGTWVYMGIHGYTTRCHTHCGMHGIHWCTWGQGHKSNIAAARMPRVSASAALYQLR